MSVQCISGKATLHIKFYLPAVNFDLMKANSNKSNKRIDESPKPCGTSIFTLISQSVVLMQPVVAWLSFISVSCMVSNFLPCMKFYIIIQ